MRHLGTGLALTLALATAAVGAATDVGRIKQVEGTVHIERGGQSQPATPGAAVRVADRIVTGRDGSVGITFADDSVLSAGPNSSLQIDQFRFDERGRRKPAFESTLHRGTLSAVSGRIVKQAPGAMRVRTPTTILGVRGTEFVLEVSEPAQ